MNMFTMTTAPGAGDHIAMAAPICHYAVVCVRVCMFVDRFFLSTSFVRWFVCVSILCIVRCQSGSLRYLSLRLNMHMSNQAGRFCLEQASICEVHIPLLTYVCHNYCQWLKLFVPKCEDSDSLSEISLISTSSYRMLL